MKKLWPPQIKPKPASADAPADPAEARPEPQRGRVAEVESRLQALRQQGVSLSPRLRRPVPPGPSLPPRRPVLPRAPDPPPVTPAVEPAPAPRREIELPELELESGEAGRASPTPAARPPARSLPLLDPSLLEAKPSRPPLRTRRLRIGETLLQKGLVSQAQLDQALQVQKETGARLGAVLIQQGVITAHEMLRALAEQLGVEVLPLGALEIDPAARDVLPAEIVRRHEVIPLWASDKVLRVAIADPTNIAILDELRFLTGRWIQVVVAPDDQVRELIARAYATPSVPEEAMGDPASFDIESVDIEGETEDDKPNVYELIHESGQQPVVSLVSFLLADSVKRRASDIHIEPFETSLRVRYRVDGELQNVASPPQRLHQALISRIKVMAGMDISKRRIPQDGHLAVRHQGKVMHYRASTLPTVYGEKCVLRLLSKDADLAELSRIGMPDAEFLRLRKAISAPQGLVLVTGPTGSGKTTTVHAALNWISRPTNNVTTLEDPVEVTLPGINHVQIAERAGLSFADALRALLRQDPDVVFVGEMRDAEVSTIAIRASLTGHLVLSTLHTNSAMESFARLDDMGVERYLVAATIQTVVAQRLLRRVCEHCAAPATAEDFAEVIGVDEMLERMAGLGLPIDLKLGQGCEECLHSGYRKRLAVYEVMPIDRVVRELLRRQAPAEELAAAVAERGFRPMLENGLRACAEGLTTLKEVQRVLASAD